MGKVGLVQPLVWNKRTGNLVGGHQRLAQIDALERNREYKLTVAVVDVDETRERELNVLLNNPDVCGEWDLPKLKEVLGTELLDMTNTGFGWGEFQQMFGEAPSQPSEDHQKQVSESVAQIEKAYERFQTAHVEKDDRDFYVVLVFGSWNDRRDFLETFGFEDNRYQDGRTIAALFADLGGRRVKQTGHPAPARELKRPGVGENPPEVGPAVEPA